MNEEPRPPLNQEISPALLAQRAEEIALSDGRTVAEVTDADYARARAELSRPVPAEQLNPEPADGFRRPDIAMATPGMTAANEYEDDAQIGATLVEQGVQEAVHDEFVESGRETLAEAAEEAPDETKEAEAPTEPLPAATFTEPALAPLRVKPAKAKPKAPQAPAKRPAPKAAAKKAKAAPKPKPRPKAKTKAKKAPSKAKPKAKIKAKAPARRAAPKKTSRAKGKPGSKAVKTKAKAKPKAKAAAKGKRKRKR